MYKYCNSFRTIGLWSICFVTLSLKYIRLIEKCTERKYKAKCKSTKQMLTLLPHRPGALPYEKCPNPSSFQSLLPLVLWKGNQLIYFQSYSIVLLIFELHMNRIIVFLNFFYKWLFSLKIVRCICVTAYSNCSLPHIVLYLGISHSLMYLPGPPLRVIWVISN